MSKKVVIIQGSPRENANSTLLSEQLAEGVRSAGGSVDIFPIREMNVAPCTACEGCHQEKSTGCVIKDDMQQIYPAVVDADAIVFATPIYWFSLSAQIKAPLDRLYALIKPDDNPLAGKSIALVMSYGAPDALESGCVNVINMFQDACRFLDIEYAGSVHASALKPGEVASNEALLQKARDLGTTLAGD